MANPRIVSFSKEQIEIMEQIMVVLDDLVDICKALAPELRKKEDNTPAEIDIILIMEEIALLETRLDEAPSIPDTEDPPKIIV